MSAVSDRRQDLPMVDSPLGISWCCEGWGSGGVTNTTAYPTNVKMAGRLVWTTTPALLCLRNRVIRKPHRAQHDGLPFIKRFPGQAGAPIPNMGRSTPGYEQLQEKLGLDNIWTPFQSQCDWELLDGQKTGALRQLRWASFLQLMGELNRIIDNEMPARPRFRCEEVEIGGENFEFYFREVVPCLRTLFGDPEFAKRLVFAPECHYQDSDHTVRVFSEMHTGKWWWSVQQSLEAQNPGATVLPIIISSDKTQLTHFRNKSAYPVYLSIGNIPKDLRRKVTQHAQLLMGYIPTTRLQHIPNKAARRRALANLFHECMHKILSPIESYGENGIAMVTGDGTWYRCHPVLAAVIGDYPEQCLVTCTYNGQCPKCVAPRSELGSGSRFPLRDFKTAVSIFALADGNPTIFNAACQEARLKPTYHPFWEQFPYTNIFLSITPGHPTSIHQGVTKHLIRGSQHSDQRRSTRDVSAFHQATMLAAFREASPAFQS
ncbi:hypothetical protein BJY52DRAFT_1189255 [Lactarius psammicola]|nr:hypothetical protein BJY52DRAFT_1189255 [Lactarius psammicola]